MLDGLSDYLDAAAKSDAQLVNDRLLLAETLTFRLQKNGKFEADSKCHDDCVMKWAIAERMRHIRISKPGYMGAA